MDHNSYNKDIKENEKTTINREMIRKHLAREFRINPEQIDILLKTLSKTLIKCLDDADKSLKNKNMDSLSKAAHALKGPLLNLGLNDLSNIARHIELNAKSEKDTLQNSKNQKQYQDGIKRLYECINPLI